MSDVTWTPVTVRLSQLTPWERNPKRISKAHAARLLDLWQRLGQFQTIAIGPAGEVYDGHQRLSVLKAAHGKGFEVQALQSSRALSEKEREELTVAAHVGTVGQFDWDALSGWDAGDLQQWGFDTETLTNWQTDIGALRTMLDAEQEPQGDDPGAQVDKAAELQAKWGTATGQLWQLGEHRLIVGDCTDAATVARVMGGERAQAIVTDPPYDVGGGGKYSSAYQMDVGQAAEFHSFDEDFLPLPFLTLSFDLVSPVNWFVFTSPYLAWKYYQPFFYERFDVSMLFVWAKPFAVSNVRGVGFAKSYEIAVYAWNKGHYFEALPGTENYDVWQGTSNQGGASSLHPTSKPVALIERVVRQLSPAGAIVYDPFLGSGTTLIACERLGRRCRAAEIEPGYVAVCLERWHQMTGKTPVLLAGTGDGT